MPEVDGSGDGKGDEGRSEQGVGDAAVMLEGGDGTAECPEYVEVRGLGGEGHGEGCVGGAAIESGAGETGSGEEVGDWFHWSTSVAGWACESFL